MVFYFTAYVELSDVSVDGNEADGVGLVAGKNALQVVSPQHTGSHVVLGVHLVLNQVVAKYHGRTFVLKIRCVIICKIRLIIHVTKLHFHRDVRVLQRSKKSIFVMEIIV